MPSSLSRLSELHRFLDMHGSSRRLLLQKLSRHPISFLNVRTSPVDVRGPRAVDLSNAQGQAPSGRHDVLQSHASTVEFGRLLVLVTPECGAKCNPFKRQLRFAGNIVRAL